MIGRIRGTLISKKIPLILLDVAGVGYEITVTTGALHQLPAIGLEATLCTHFVVREDAMTLYGFADEQERTLFRELIRVSGIGPKVAMTILSGMNATELVHLVRTSEIHALMQLPGIGKKTAERIVIELRDRLQSSIDSGDLNMGSMPTGTQTIQAEAESALIALGYKPAEAEKMIRSIAVTEQRNVETLVRDALRTKMRAS